MKKHSQFARFKFALAGLKSAWQQETSLRTEVYVFAAVLAGMVWRRPPLFWWVAILLAGALVMMVELLNTALENLCDAVHPEQHPKIGAAKDCAAAAVFVVNLAAMALLAAFLVSSAWGAEASVPKETVVLVHGIMNKPFVMDRIADRLEQEGYEVQNWGYPSTEGLIEQHAASLNELLLGLAGQTKIHFVGFSQGAIIIRYTLTHYAIKNAGRFVMIAPPNHGSEMAQDFYQYAWFRGLYGDKSIKQLFTRQNEFLKTCGIPKVEFGIIAGGKGDGKGFSARIPGDDDGAISVASTRLEGMRDMIILPHQHTPLVFAGETASQVVQFLKEGKFKR